MKFQIDTENKTIKLTESVKLKDLTNMVKKLFPNNEWKEYSVETDVEVVWSNPIIIDRYQPYQQYPWITCGTDSSPYVGSGNLNGSNFETHTPSTSTTTFNVELTANEV